VARNGFIFDEEIVQPLDYQSSLITKCRWVQAS